MKEWFNKVRTLLLLGSVAFILAGCGKENLSALRPKGQGAGVSLDLIILTTVVMTLVFIAVMVILIIVLIRFRKRDGDKVITPEQTEGSKLLETIWTTIPIILVIIMAVPTVYATFQLADSSDQHEHMNINVTGKQFWWHFDYENEELATSQDLYIPVDTKVYINLLSDDVAHSFWVPSLEGKLDVNPENVNTMFIEAYEEGVYWGKCAEFCGGSHALMDFKVVVLPQDEYDQWVADMTGFDSSEVELDAVAQEGEEIFSQSCIGCHATDNQDYAAGSPAPAGPNLANFGNRLKLAGYKELNKDNLVQWIKDPESLKPDNLMTGTYSISDEDIEKVAEYLLQLKSTEVTAELDEEDNE